MSKRTFYVTTPIYYGTAKPHLGSLYSTLIADVINRWKQLQSKETFFLTGTDEHGQKIAQAAQQAGMTPQQFVDSFITAYKETWYAYTICYSQFIRTTDPLHIKGVQVLIKRLMDQGDIYKATYQGWYCILCETYVPSAEGQLPGPLCPTCNRATVAIEEDSYFFKLSAYQDRLLAFYKENPDFIVPVERFNEVKSFVESGLKDLCISRATVKWGVPFPGDPEQVVYVWVDALCNYITAIGYGDEHRLHELQKWWPANVQVLGKDIIRFHGVYWPAILMAVQLLPPRQLLVHGWIQVNKQKMSKSRGNVVDPMELAATYGADQVRYYLMRQIPINTDGDFSIADLEKHINTDLANDLGNLLNRMLSLAQKYELLHVNPPKIWQQPALDLRDEAWDMVCDYEMHMNDYEFHLAIARVWKFINHVNAYFHTQQPWKIAQRDYDLFSEVIAATCHSLRIIAILLWPIMPEKMEELLACIGHTLRVKEASFASLDLEIWHHTFILKPSMPLFKKIEENVVQQTIQESQEVVTTITIEDLKKVELRIGTIVDAVAIAESEKLIKMTVDLGPVGTRCIVAGIRTSYQPEHLIGKQGIFVCNFPPRAMMGVESHGMMLITRDSSGNVRLVAPESVVPNGTPLQ